MGSNSGLGENGGDVTPVLQSQTKTTVVAHNNCLGPHPEKALILKRIKNSELTPVLKEQRPGCQPFIVKLLLDHSSRIQSNFVTPTDKDNQAQKLPTKAVQSRQ